MMPTEYKTGVYLNRSLDHIAIGIGFCSFGKEKYVYFNLLFWELAIGRTTK